MTKPQLTVERLLQAGFEEVGCWELNSARDLAHSIQLPQQAGVYAFAINAVVQYVGLASRSLRQRLGFYRKPGASQRTNVRLNEIIRGHLGAGTMVRILIGHPQDFEWNGLKISGGEGLEAGLISQFDLPWNMRGASPPVVKQAASSARSHAPRQKGTRDRVLEAIGRRPGMTELEIAKAIYGPSAVQQQVNQECRYLAGSGLIERRGAGGRSDPYVYYAPAPGSGRE